MSGLVNKFKRLSGLEEEEPSVLDQVSEATSLSFKHRLIAFAVCMGIGVVLLLIGMAFVATIIINPVPFATLYTLGNIALVASTFFIVGPLKQLKALTKPSRLAATVCYFVALGLTLFSALYWSSWPLTLICLVLQLIALVWYVISHIPYAQTCCMSLIRGSVAV